MWNVAIKIGKWLLPQRAVKYCSDRFSTYPRRWLIILLYVIFIQLADGWKDAWRELQPKAKTFIGEVMGFSPPATATTNAPPAAGAANPPKVEFSWWRLLWKYKWSLGSMVWWIVPAILLALTITAISDGAAALVRERVVRDVADITSHPGQQYASEDAQLKTLAKILVYDTGFTAAYVAEVGKPVTEQKYAADMIAAVKSSSRIRLLTIAGYEYLGSGADSLLYKHIVGRSVRLEIVLLDPEKGQAAIRERVEDLMGTRDSTYTDKKLKSQIEETRETLCGLHKREMAIDLRFIAEHPVFRILILEDCLFLSAYVADAHGHESPVYKLSRATSTPAGLSWYAAFEKYFRNIQSRAVTVEPCLAKPS